MIDKWSSIAISLRIFHSLLWSTQSMKQKWMSIWNPLAFSMVQQMLAIWSLPFLDSFYIWKFLVHVLLKPSMKDFEHNLASMWNKCNCTVVWTFFGIALFGDWNENWPLPVLWPLISFPNLLTYCTLTASSLRVFNSSGGSLSPPLALFVVKFPKAHLTSHSRMSGSRWVATPLWLSGSLKPFFV